MRLIILTRLFDPCFTLLNCHGRCLLLSSHVHVDIGRGLEHHLGLSCISYVTATFAESWRQLNCSCLHMIVAFSSRQVHRWHAFLLRAILLALLHFGVRLLLPSVLLRLSIRFSYHLLLCCLNLLLLLLQAFMFTQ